MKVLIFAAGLGTRLLPLTKQKPKALVELNGKPILEHLIRNLKSQGFNDFIINVHHFADQIESFLLQNNNFDCSIQISDERSQLLETGGGMLKAKPFLSANEDFIVHNADIFSDINLQTLIDEHHKNNSMATLAVQNRQTSRKLLFDEENYLCRWKNYSTNEVKDARPGKGNMEAWAFSGIQIIHSDIFKHISETGKFSIIDLYLRLAKNHKISAFETKHSYWLDLGKPKNITEAENLLKNKF